MCLTVDFKKEIYDDKVYTFYKRYTRVGNTFVTPFQRCKKVNEGLKLIAKYRNNRPLPEDGQEAFNRTKGGDRVYEGVHAYTAKDDAFLWSETVFEVHVLGKHIMAFGRNGDVAFTRGIMGKRVRQ